MSGAIKSASPSSTRFRSEPLKPTFQPADDESPEPEKDDDDDDDDDDEDQDGGDEDKEDEEEGGETTPTYKPLRKITKAQRRLINTHDPHRPVSTIPEGARLETAGLLIRQAQRREDFRHPAPHPAADAVPLEIISSNTYNPVSVFFLYDLIFLF